jgi:Carboxypeptidase regulatory-like domain
MSSLPENPPMVSGKSIRLIGAVSMAGKPGWAIPLIAAVAFVVFFIIVAGSASAAAIHGVVTDDNGVRVAGATVTIYQDGKEYVSPSNPWKTDITGYYEFAGLPDGTYYVQADKGSFFSRSEPATLAGNEVQVNLLITGYDSKAPAPTVQVRVTPTPTPAPPTTIPTPKPCPTLVPLPAPQEEPGFGLLLALISLGIIVLVRKL